MNDRAKELFFAYRGLHGQMANDGVYEEYKSYGVPKKQEALWLKEMLQGTPNVLPQDPVDAKIAFARKCSLVKQASDPSQLEGLYGMLRRVLKKQTSEISMLTVLECYGDTLRYFSRFASVGEHAEKLRALVLQMKNNTRDADVAKNAENLLGRLDTL